MIPLPILFLLFDPAIEVGLCGRGDLGRGFAHPGAAR